MVRDRLAEHQARTRNRTRARPRAASERWQARPPRSTLWATHESAADRPETPAMPGRARVALPRRRATRSERKHARRDGRGLGPPRVASVVLLDSDAAAGLDASICRRATVSAFAEDRLEAERPCGPGVAAPAPRSASRSTSKDRRRWLPLSASRQSGRCVEAAALVLASQEFVANGRGRPPGLAPECCIAGANRQPWPCRSGVVGGVPNQQSRLRGSYP